MVGVTNIFLLFSLVIIACFFTLKGLKKVKLPELIS
jgi:hypothetical protein